jgi:hypothetical protein
MYDGELNAPYRPVLAKIQSLAYCADTNQQADTVILAMMVLQWGRFHYNQDINRVLSTEYRSLLTNLMATGCAPSVLDEKTSWKQAPWVDEILKRGTTSMIDELQSIHRQKLLPVCTSPLASPPSLSPLEPATLHTSSSDSVTLKL